MTQLRYPTTLSELRADEAYETFFLRRRKIIVPHPTSKPWRLMVQRPSGKWATKDFGDFKDALAKAERMLDDSSARDVSIICKQRVFPMPAWMPTFFGPREQWCGRCRRPTIFQTYSTSHPAMYDARILIEDTRRCFFCGMREEMAQQWQTRT